MEEVKVLGSWDRPFSFRVELALKLKGVEYEFIQEDLSHATTKSPLLLQSNPVHKMVPVLIHNGKPIAESLVILEYIDETWPNGHPILPKNPYDRAAARFWAKVIDEKYLPAFAKANLASGEEQVKGKEEVEESLKFLDNELKGKKFFGGDEVGFADIAGSIVGYWSVITDELSGLELLSKDKFPHLWAWIEEFVNSSCVKKHLPDREKLVDTIRARYFPNTK